MPCALKAPCLAKRPGAPRLAWGTQALAGAARVVAAVVHEGNSADAAFAHVLDGSGGALDDRAAIKAIALGTLRWYLRLAPAIDALLARPADKKAATLHALLVCAAHQIEYSRNAPEGVVDGAVNTVRALGHPRATGFANAVLRRYLRERVELFRELDLAVAVRRAHPPWLVHLLEDAVGEGAESVMAANNAHPPMTLRVDLTRGSTANYLAELTGAGIEAVAVPWCAGAITLLRPVTVDALPGFWSGRISVQDAAAQLAATLLAVQPGMRVLDACAAPGGKTGHLLELVPDADLLAVDNDGARLTRVRENLQRLGRNARVLEADLASGTALAGEAPFDRILLDAPCSATGVIRRHPDIKLLRRESDIGVFARTQRSLLEACFRNLAERGRLLYCTCSVLRDENDKVLDAFLRATPAAEPADWPGAVTLPPGIRRKNIGLQLLPGGEAGADGFYYACLTRRPLRNG